MRKLKTIDPVSSQPSVCESDMGAAGLSPMDPPDAYSPPAKGQIPVEAMHPFLQGLVKEHDEIKERLRDFEDCLATLQRERALPRAVHERLGSFFLFFDRSFVDHNRKEERDLFPLLKTRLIEKGEHSPTDEQVTGVDVLQNEHLAALKSVTTVSSLLSLIPMLEDPKSREVVLDLAIGGGKDLVEAVNLHIFREDHIMFSIAQELLTTEELNAIARPFA